MGDYITKKSDKGGSKAKEEYIAKSNIFEKPEYIKKKEKKIEYIKKKEKKIEYIKKKEKPKEWITLKKKEYPIIGDDY